MKLLLCVAAAAVTLRLALLLFGAGYTFLRSLRRYNRLAKDTFITDITRLIDEDSVPVYMMQIKSRLFGKDNEAQDVEASLLFEKMPTIQVGARYPVYYDASNTPYPARYRRLELFRLLLYLALLFVGIFTCIYTVRA